MKNVLKTSPVKYPVSLEEAKQQCNIILGWTDDDEILQRLIKVATEEAEQITRRRFITQTWYRYLNEWPPNSEEIILPFGQLQSVTAVKYTDTDGDETTWDTDEYNVDSDSDPGRVTLEYGYTWPTVTLHPQNPIEIEFVCGYGDDASDVPELIRHGILLLINDFYENRENVLIGQGFTYIKTGRVLDLLIKHRIYTSY